MYTKLPEVLISRLPERVRTSNWITHKEREVYGKDLSLIYSELVRNPNDLDFVFDQIKEGISKSIDTWGISPYSKRQVYIVVTPKEQYYKWFPEDKPEVDQRLKYLMKRRMREGEEFGGLYVCTDLLDKGEEVYGEQAQCLLLQHEARHFNANGLTTLPGSTQNVMFAEGVAGWGKDGQDHQLFIQLIRNSPNLVIPFLWNLSWNDVKDYSRYPDRKTSFHENVVYAGSYSFISFLRDKLGVDLVIKLYNEVSKISEKDYSSNIPDIFNKFTYRTICEVANDWLTFLGLDKSQGEWNQSKYNDSF